MKAKNNIKMLLNIRINFQFLRNFLRFIKKEIGNQITIHKHAAHNLICEVKF